MRTASFERSRVVVLAGLPGSGKSTWAGRRGPGVLSSDAIRLLLADDENDQSVHASVFATLRRLLRERLELRRPVTYVDATNSTRRERRSYIRLAQLFDARAEAVYFETPLEICKQRNRSRERVVPEWAIDAMAARFEPPSLDEGFEAVTVYGGPPAGRPAFEE